MNFPCNGTNCSQGGETPETCLFLFFIFVIVVGRGDSYFALFLLLSIVICFSFYSAPSVISTVVPSLDTLDAFRAFGQLIAS